MCVVCVWIGVIGVCVMWCVLLMCVCCDVVCIGVFVVLKLLLLLFERDDIGVDGVGVVVVGVGVCGCVFVDVFVDVRVLLRVEMWVMYVDEDVFERSRAVNRWRLSSANVEVMMMVIEGNVVSVVRVVMVMGVLRVMVVVCVGGEVVESVTAFTRWATREKNARAKKKWFFGFKGVNCVLEGEIMIVGVIELFMFEGRWK